MREKVLFLCTYQTDHPRALARGVDSFCKDTEKNIIGLSQVDISAK